MGKCQSQTAAIKSVFFEVMKNVAVALAVAVVCAVVVAVAVADTFRRDHESYNLVRPYKAL